ncbi:MAG: RNA polymerase sigma factor [Bryobacteraceae bacterium]
MDQIQRPAADLEKTFREHHLLVFRAAYRITGSYSDAEDVLQNVFLRLLRRAAGDAVASIESYLYRAAVNMALDLMRSRQVARGVPLDDAEGEIGADWSGAPDRAHDSAELRRRLREAVARLSPQAAEIFALRYFEDRGNQEIAELIGTTPGTVAVTLHRTREKLQREFRSWLGD